MELLPCCELSSSWGVGSGGKTHSLYRFCKADGLTGTPEILISWNIDPESDDLGISLASLIAVFISHGCHMKSLEYVNLTPWLLPTPKLRRVSESI